MYIPLISLHSQNDCSYKQQPKKSTGGKTAKISTCDGFVRKLNLTNTHTAFPPLPILSNFSYFYKKFRKVQLLQKNEKRWSYMEWNFKQVTKKVDDKKSQTYDEMIYIP